MIQILRDMGREVPEWAQDPESEGYYHWLEELIEDGEIHQTKFTAPMRTLDGKRKDWVLEAVKEEGIWQVK